MSKYTTELRYICESKAGLTESSTDYETVINQSYAQIIHPNVHLYDQAYEPVLYKKIIKHYYFDEIAHETVGRFIMRLNLKLEEILPYYNKLYESALLEFNPFYDVDYTRTGTKSDDGTNSATRTDNLNTLRTDNLNQQRTDNLQNSAQSESMDLFSDTPEGQLSGVNDAAYLTNARKINSSASGSNTGTQTTANTGTQTTANTGTQTNAATIHNEGEYMEHVIGKMGTGNYSELLSKFRETILNIDMMIIEELQPLFMEVF